MSFVNKKVFICLILIFTIFCQRLSYAKSDIITMPKGPVAYGTKAYPSLAQQIIGEPIGTIVTFGHYEQDNNRANGKEPVKWILLDVDETDNSATLISLYLIDCLRFDDENRYVTWETSTLRDYMNTVMILDLFDKEEVKCLKISSLTNYPNPYYENESSGNPTYDFLYIPGIEDIVIHFSNKDIPKEEISKELMKPNPLRSAIGTKYAIARGLRVTPENHYMPQRGNYFLRTIGKTGHRRWYGDVYVDYFQSYITEIGELKPDGTGVDSIDDGIRPMVQVYF